MDKKSIVRIRFAIVMVAGNSLYLPRSKKKKETLYVQLEHSPVNSRLSYLTWIFKKPN